VKRSEVVFDRIYLPQPEQEQLEPQLQLEAEEHPHSPFILIVCMVLSRTVSWNFQVLYSFGVKIS